MNTYIGNSAVWLILVAQSACSAGDLGSIPGLGWSTGEEKGNPLHYSCWENPMDGGAWLATAHGVPRVRHDLVTKPPPPQFSGRIWTWTQVFQHWDHSYCHLPTSWFGTNTVTVQLLSPVRLCDPMGCSMPGLPVHHQLPVFTQSHVHWVRDTFQPSHLSSPSPPAFNLYQHQGFFEWVSYSHQVAKILEFQLQHQSFQWIFRTDFL